MLKWHRCDADTNLPLEQYIIRPCSFQDGERGYLEGLASRYADLFSTHYGDVLNHLEDLRRRDWAEMSPKERIAVTPGTPPNNLTGTPLSSANHGLTTSLSQPIYVPGKYSVRYRGEATTEAGIEVNVKFRNSSDIFSRRAAWVTRRRTRFTGSGTASSVRRLRGNNKDWWCSRPATNPSWCNTSRVTKRECYSMLLEVKLFCSTTADCIFSSRSEPQIYCWTSCNITLQLVELLTKTIQLWCGRKQ